MESFVKMRMTRVMISCVRGVSCVNWTETTGHTVETRVMDTIVRGIRCVSWIDTVGHSVTADSPVPGSGLQYAVVMERRTDSSVTWRSRPANQAETSRFNMKGNALTPAMVMCVREMRFVTRTETIGQAVTAHATVPGCIIQYAAVMDRRTAISVTWRRKPANQAETSWFNMKGNAIVVDSSIIRGSGVT